ncbi:MAG: hypothetical protein IPN53_23275 [Comamonadaceae bacterium]|nr:hypothetical protein [Comamonadaceae bacterium]
MQRGSKIAVACVSIPTFVLGALSMKETPTLVVATTSNAQVFPTQTLKTSPPDATVIDSAHRAVPDKSATAALGNSQSVTTASRLISPKDRSDLQVNGILGASNRSQSIAIITVAGRPPTLVRAGDELFDWRIVEIESDKVKLRRDQEIISISIDSVAQQIPSMESSAPPIRPPFQAGPQVAGVPGLD